MNLTIEEIVISYLIGQNIQLIGEHVYAEKPVDPEPVHVIVSRSGGSEGNFIRRYVVHIDVYVKRDEEAGLNKLLALKLHEAVISAMKSLPESAPVYGCHKNADYDATRTDTKEYRYQSMWEVTM